MIINHEKKTVFISVPKSGSTSIMVLLNEASIHDKPDIYHMTVSEALARQPDLADYHFMGLVRNPFDRAVSTYFDIKLDKGHSAWAADLAQSESFGEFVSKAEGDDYYKRIRHLWPQRTFFTAPTDAKVTVLKYEDYENSARTVCDAFGVPVTGLGRWRDTSRRRKPYQHYLEKQSTEVLKTIYSDDFSAYRYDIDPTPNALAVF